MSGKHARRRGDNAYQPPAFGQAGEEAEVKNFDANIGHQVIRAADDRLFGRMPYDRESGSKPSIDPDTGERRSE